MSQEDKWAGAVINLDVNLPMLGHSEFRGKEFRKQTPVM